MKRTCMHMKIGDFDHGNRFRVSRYAYNINFKQFHRKTKKLRLIWKLAYKKFNAHTCIFRENDIHSTQLQMICYHILKRFLIDPLSSSWEHCWTKKYQKKRKRNRVKTCFQMKLIMIEECTFVSRIAILISVQDKYYSIKSKKK